MASDYGHGRGLGREFSRYRCGGLTDVPSRLWGARGGGIIRPTWVSVPHLWLVLGEKVIVLSEGLQIYLFYHPFGWWVPYTCDAKIRFLICTIVTCMAHFSSLCFFWVLFWMFFVQWFFMSPGRFETKMVQNGPKWTKMDQNGPKWSKMVRNGQKWSEIVRNGPKWQKWSEMVWNGQKWSQRFPNGPKWFQIVRNCPKWSKMVQNGQTLFKMVRNGLKWSKIVCKLPQTTPY